MAKGLSKSRLLAGEITVIIVFSLIVSWINHSTAVSSTGAKQATENNRSPGLFQACLWILSIEYCVTLEV